MILQRQPQTKNPSEPAVPLELASLRKVEFVLGVSRSTFRSIAARSGAYYAPFVKREKLRPFQRKFKTPKKREIDNPLDPLKSLQIKINKRLLGQVELPEFFYGGVGGKNLRDNIDRHMGAKVLVTLDIASFFPSIKPRMIYLVWKRLGCSPAISALLTKLTTYRRRLPQGASTSTTLANLTLALLYPEIAKECETSGIRYSTWVDDLAFSGDHPQLLIPLVVSALKRAGLKVSRKKLRIMTSGERQILNNIVLGRSVSVEKQKIIQVKAGIHKLRVGVISASGMSDYLRALKGRITFIRTINNRSGEELMMELREVLES